MKRIEYLRKRFNEYGIAPRRQMGQNFLLDKNQVIKVCEDADISVNDTILEVGPGSGLLSTVLAETGAEVICVEYDKKLFKLVSEELARFTNAEVMEADILKNKNSINPFVLERIEEIYKSRQDGRLKCISNLPYSIATPFIANLCSNSLPWQTGVFMIQYEVAERLVAGQGRSDYGNLSIISRLACSSVTIERSVPPQVFWPRPKVKSAIVKMEFLPAENRTAIPWQSLRKVTNAIFTSRRKNLRNSIRTMFGKKEDKKSELFIAKAGIDIKKRGEEFSPFEILELAKHLKEFQDK
ncbi:MAG: 16S rRNA (adenine(1518)-N(6)/adenine(1519)-N(6))-dimethyltransferase RsmA [Planctomycetota bacterium]